MKRSNSSLDALERLNVVLGGRSDDAVNITEAIDQIADAIEAGGGGGSSVIIDPTLTQAGRAADAKAAGDAIRNIDLSTDITLSVSGKPADSKTVGNRFIAIENAVSSPKVANSANEMIDTDNVYVYTGSEAGYNTGHWYYYYDLMWHDGGVYNAVAVNTDESLTIPGQAADAKASGDKINNLNASLRYVTEDLKSEMLSKHIETNVGIGNIVDITAVVGTTSAHRVVQCSKGDKFYIKGSGVNSYARAWAFVDNDYKLVSISPNKPVDEEIQAPEDGYAIFNFSSSSYSGDSVLQFKKLLQTANQESIKIFSELYSENVTSQFIRDKYIKTDDATGTVISNAIDNPVTSTGRAYYITPIRKGEKIVISGTGGSELRLWTFTDINFVMLRHAKQNESVNMLELVALQDGYFIANVLTDRSYSLDLYRYLVLSSDTVQNLDNIAPIYSSSDSYAYHVGDYVVYDEKLWKCTSDTTGGTWDELKWTEVVVMNEVLTIDESISQATDDISELQESLVQATDDISELQESIAQATDDISDLTSALDEETSARTALNRSKINQPMTGSTPNYGTNGQALRSLGDGTTEWADIGLPTDAQTSTAVNAWLNNHPEATTTVVDGSLTDAKFTSDLKIKAITGQVNKYITCADMIADMALENGMFAQTGGYHVVNDGGNALYYVTISDNYNGYYETLDNQLIAIPIITDSIISPQMYGAYADGTHDDTTALQNALNEGFRTGAAVQLEGSYNISSPLTVYGATNARYVATTVCSSNRGNALITATAAMDKMIDINSSGVRVVNITIRDIALDGNRLATDGIYFSKQTSSCWFENIKIDYCLSYGINASVAPNYLNSFVKIRCGNCGTGVNFSGTGLKTSLRFADCYMQNSDNGYKLSGIYCTVINCCADGIADTAFALEDFFGSLVSCGSESKISKRMFYCSNSKVSIVGPYTWGNYTDSEAEHFYVTNTSVVNVYGGYVLVNGDGVNTPAPGKLYELGNTGEIHFHNTKWDSYALPNSNNTPSNKMSLETNYGASCSRFGKLAYIGMDCAFTDGNINPGNATDGGKGNAIYFGLGDSPAVRLSDNYDMQWQSKNVKGDILLTGDPESIGGIGWVQASDTQQRWGTGKYLKIPVILSGTTSARPSSGMVNGQMYFDTTLSKPIWWATDKWVDANGATI